MILLTITSTIISVAFIYLYFKQLNKNKDITAKYLATKDFAEATISKSPNIQNALNKTKKEHIAVILDKVSTHVNGTPVSEGKPRANKNRRRKPNNKD